MSKANHSTIEELQARLTGVGYIADEALVMALHLALRLGRPLLLEGEAGVGKTEVAKALARMLDARMIRLQCYEGLDANAAIYEWNYQRQLLAIKAHELDESADQTEERIFSERYLLRRPLLEAISQETPPVLLIDEIDRADEEFEAYLLEILSDFQVSVPELGTIRATSIPQVILTANGTRDLSDALRRRCLYAFVEFPEPKRELQILKARIPTVGDDLAAQVVRFIAGLRREDLEKKPGIAETLDWVAALVDLNVSALTDDPDALRSSLVCLLKTEADAKAVTPEVLARLADRAA
ncbi:AAA family ATPase [Algihabitans albus]|uniref:AAA family ATPase n=1 Tax=Algihabitans albus TaxID=2164067 RepID=UPI000E5D68D4|nr:MoxR family ATPase [Algihabitans albus]